MPNPINIKELIADREAGTDGPWRVRAGHRHDPEECDLSICGDIFVLADINGPNYSHQEPNARRIARLPDLEAAYIEAISIIRQVASGVGSTRHVLAARKFLGDTE